MPEFTPRSMRARAHARKPLGALSPNVAKPPTGAKKPPVHKSVARVIGASSIGATPSREHTKPRIVGAAVPALTPMALEVYAHAGYTQRQVAGVSAALFTALVNLANIAGPLLGGALKASDGGLPLATTLYGLVGGGVSAVCCARLMCMYARRPDQGCLAGR